MAVGKRHNNTHVSRVLAHQRHPVVLLTPGKVTPNAPSRFVLCISLFCTFFFFLLLELK